MKKAMPLSHFAAARATSAMWLRRAPRNMRMRAQMSRRSPEERPAQRVSISIFFVFMPPKIREARGHLWGGTPRFLEKVIHIIHNFPYWTRENGMKPQINTDQERFWNRRELK